MAFGIRYFSVHLTFKAVWRRRPMLACLTALLGAIAPTSQAASITLNSSSVPSLNRGAPIVYHLLRLTGPFEEGDSAKLRPLLERLKAGAAHSPGKPLATIELSSRGGDIYEALKIGYLFREFDVATMVRKEDICLSACALAFLGGTERHVPPDLTPDRSIEIGGQVGFHNFNINPSSAQLSAAKGSDSALVTGFDLARGGSSLLVRYAATMAIDPGFIARLLGQPTELMEYIDIDEKFVTLSSCPIGIDRPKISDELTATNICNHATGWFSPADPSQARRMNARQAMRHLLELVQRNVEVLGLKGPLAAQLAGVLAARDERLVDAVYADLRTAGVPLPDLSGVVFEVGGYASGDSRMQCHVSFSRDNPDRYDVVIEGASGLAHAFRSAPQNCRRVFLWDRSDMLNPSGRPSDLALPNQ